MQPKSKYKCRKCHCTWEREKPPIGGELCPMCYHLYVDWLNHEEVCTWLANHTKPGEKRTSFVVPGVEVREE